MGHLIRMQGLGEMLEGHLPYSVSAIGGARSLLQKAGLKTEARGAGMPKLEEVLLDFDPKRDILVLDGYNYDLPYQSRLKEEGFTLVRIDDFSNKHVVADLFINHAPGVEASEYTKEEYSQLALGSEYALLRKALLDRAADRSSEVNIEMKNILLSFGSNDPEGLVQKFADMLFECSGVKQVVVLGGKAENENLEEKTGLSAPEMVELVDQMDLVICSSSNIFMEMACLSKACASGYYVDNQMNIAKSIEQSGSAFYLGDLRTTTMQKLEAVLNAGGLFWQSTFESKKKMIDGRQQERILKLFSDVA